MSEAPDDPMLDRDQVCAFFTGAGRPIHRTTLYRWINEGRIPRPVRIGPRLSRWRRSDCQEALDAMIAADPGSGRAPHKPRDAT